MEAIKNLLENCAGLKSREKLLIVADPETTQVGKAVAAQAELVAETRLIVIPPMAMHGQEPTEKVAQAMLESTVIFGLTKKSLAHTKARFNATQKGSRYLSLPDYSLELLNHKALSFDFSSLAKEAEALSKKLSSASYCQVTTALGTDISFKLGGRAANSCPGLARKPGELASPPDAEVNIAPVESETNGIIVVDGSIPCDQLGVLRSPVTLKIKNGKIYSFEGKDSVILKKIFQETRCDSSYILGELGIGLNPEANLCGVMLVDEGCRGTVHFGFGSNSTIGGSNSAPIHLDMVIKKPTLTLENDTVIKDGQIIELP